MRYSEDKYCIGDFLGDSICTISDTVRKYESGDITATFYAVSRISSGKESLMYSRHMRNNVSNLVDNKCSEEELVRFFQRWRDKNLRSKKNI